MFRHCAFIVCLLLYCLCSRAALAAGSDSHPDALFADYSGLVEQSSKHLLIPSGPLAGWESVSYNPAVLSQETLAMLEPEHGADARYWELRYWCLQMETLLGRGVFGLDSSWAAAENESVAIELLFNAKGCGSASPFALYSLAQIQRVQRRREIDAISADQGLADAARREALICAMAADEEEFARALERINSAWPDEAWPKWWHADELFNLGEMEQACDWLEEGNAAAKCSYPACWPESYIRASVARGRRPGGEVLCGALLMAGQARSLPITMRWKEHMKEAEVAFKLGGDRQAYNALQGFACRQASAPGAGGNDCVLALVFSNAFSAVLLRNNARELSQEQVSALLDMRSEVERLQSRLRRLSRDSELFNEQLMGAVYTDLDPVNYSYESDLDAARERLRSVYRLLPARRFRAYFACTANELRAVSEDLAPRLALLDHFDFTDPQNSAQWDTY